MRYIGQVSNTRIADRTRGPASQDDISQPYPNDLRSDLSARQGATLDLLLSSAREELRESGFSELTVRKVAARAGVAPATAYNYFDSREHLVAEVFLWVLCEMPIQRPALATVAGAKSYARSLARTIAAEPEVAAAATGALLSSDAAVVRLRPAIQDRLMGGFNAHLRGVATRTQIEIIELSLSGALLRAGLGYLDYTALGALMSKVVNELVGSDD